MTNKTNADTVALARLLHSPLEEVEFLSVLDTDAQSALQNDIEQAHKSHAAHIHNKMNEGLGHLPWLIRGPIKKIFGI